MIPKVIGKTLGPWWVGGRGWVYEEALILENGQTVSPEEYKKAQAQAKQLLELLTQRGITDPLGFLSQLVGRQITYITELHPEQLSYIFEIFGGHHAKENPS